MFACMVYVLVLNSDVRHRKLEFRTWFKLRTTKYLTTIERGVSARAYRCRSAPRHFSITLLHHCQNSALQLMSLCRNLCATSRASPSTSLARPFLSPTLVRHRSAIANKKRVASIQKQNQSFPYNPPAQYHDRQQPEGAYSSTTQLYMSLNNHRH